MRNVLLFGSLFIVPFLIGFVLRYLGKYDTVVTIFYMAIPFLIWLVVLVRGPVW